MLKPVNRLMKKKDFDRVFKLGRSSFNRLVGLKTVKNDLPDSRFGVIVSAKVSRQAVVRNKIKRQIRTMLKKTAPELKTGQDYVVVACPAIIGEKYLTIEKYLSSHFSKLRLYKIGHTLK
jgi:ribonuclease P protein component